MKKKFLVIFIFLTIFFGTVIINGTGYVSASEFAKDEMTLYYENCNNSVEIYDEAIGQFQNTRTTRSVKEDYPYNNDFAGVFIDDKGILNIGTVGQQNLSTFNGQVLYIQQPFSYNYLHTIKTAIKDIAVECNINVIEIDEMLNKVVVYTSNQNIKNTIIHYLQEMNLYEEEAININVDAHYELVPTANTAYSGDKINDSILFFLNSYGTICVNVYDNETGKYGVLTNGHVAGTETMYHNGNLFQGSKLGTATKTQHSGTIDAAFVPFEDQKKWNVTTYAKNDSTTYTNIKLGTENLIIQGAPIRKIGQSSGDNTGTIISRDSTTYINYGSGIVEISNTMRYSNQSIPGDSGGPVYFDGGGQNLFLIGMNFAGPSNTDLHTYGIGCRISNVLDAFNLTPVLNGTIFETTDLENNEIRIDKLLPTIPANPDSTPVSFEIPSEINGRLVTVIGDAAFSNQPNITNYIMPTSLEIIGKNAFKGSASLNSISIPNTVTHIDSSAFENCTSLTSVTLPNSLTSIGSSAFKGCARISSIVIPNSVTHIDSGAFENCSFLQNVTFSNNLVAIGSSAFKGCGSLRNIQIPNSVEYIDASAFENCSYLQSVILSNQLVAIGSSAFKGCGSLRNIQIPSSVEYIDASAFQNCTKLETVTVLREISNITNLGLNAFAGCSLLSHIIVPINRVGEYKNKVYWSTYAGKINPSSSDFGEYDVHCLSSFNTTTTLAAGYNKIYQLNVECAKSYKITSSASFAIKMSLYDSNMNLLADSVTMANDNYEEVMISRYLSPGIYYIDLCFVDNTTSGKINTHYELTWAGSGWSISYDTNNNVLTHLHEISNSSYQNQLYYINDQGAGFYQFTIIGTKADGTTVTYPEGVITIYNDSSRNTPIDKLAGTGYSNQAIIRQNLNSMIVYLSRNGYFYIDVNMTTDALSSLYLEITAVNSQEINLFDLSETTNEQFSLFSETTIGDYFEKLVIDQAGTFTISSTYGGMQTNNFLFVLVKLNYNRTSNTYTLETKALKLMSGDNNSFTTTLILEDGIYYIGYFNKNDTNSFNVSFNRLVTQHGSNVLVTDPDFITLCGSQISVIEMNNATKSYRGTIITKNFTRLIYPDYHYDVSPSRLDYDWYSSNDYIATVTDYGTVLGKNVGTVKIMAVLKSDPSKVFVKEFTIIDDIGTESLVVHNTYTVKYSKTDNGKFLLNLEKINCPYPWFQDYNWAKGTDCHSSNMIVSNDQWGNFTISGTGCFTLTGTYIKNSRVTVVIHVIVEP